MLLKFPKISVYTSEPVDKVNTCYYFITYHIHPYSMRPINRQYILVVDELQFLLHPSHYRGHGPDSYMYLSGRVCGVGCQGREMHGESCQNIVLRRL